MRLRRSSGVRVEVFEPTAGATERTDGDGAARDELTLTTFNIWFDDLAAADRFRAIADLLAESPPDIAVFQEVTPAALAVFDDQEWIRTDYHRAGVVGGDAAQYGLLMLSRLPIAAATYHRLPGRMSRGYLVAEFTIGGRPLTVCCAHLDSGKARRRLRGRQLRRIFRTLRCADDAVVLGDLNMRDDENGRITAPYRDVWPILRPGEPGYTEDTSVNLMRYDSKQKHRQVRFDRVLLRGEAWTASRIRLLGTLPIAAERPRIFPSDHFGVHCTLVPSVDPPTPRRRSRWPRRSGRHHTESSRRHAWRP